MEIKSISSELKLMSDGIWYGVETAQVSYPTSGNEICFAIEDRSFWFRHRNECIKSVVKRYPPPAGGTIFDVGGGNGYVAKGLEEAGFDVAVVEPGVGGARNAVKRGLRNVICAQLDRKNFAGESLPAIGLFDVLEHVQDDTGYLRVLHDLLKRDGLLYLTVPAHTVLWSSEDNYAGHFRRYSMAELSRKIKSSGFRLLFHSYFFRFLVVPIFLFRSIPHWLGADAGGEQNLDSIAREHCTGGGWKVTLANALLKQEAHNLENGRSMHLGSSCLIVAQKQDRHA